MNDIFFLPRVSGSAFTKTKIKKTELTMCVVLPGEEIVGLLPCAKCTVVGDVMANLLKLFLSS